jgi:predicted LPLAT superfamily acyltransferase
MHRILIRKIVKQGWFSTKTELIDVTDMSIEELWAMRTQIDRNQSLEIILDKIIKRLPKVKDEN